MKLPHRSHGPDGRAEEHVLEPLQFAVDQKARQLHYMPVEERNGYIEHIRRQAGMMLGAGLIKEAATVETYDDPVDGTTTFRYRVHVIVPGKGDGDWFVQALNKARREGAGRALRHFAGVLVDDVRHRRHDPAYSLPEGKRILDLLRRVAADLENEAAKYDDDRPQTVTIKDQDQ